MIIIIVKLFTQDYHHDGSATNCCHFGSDESRPFPLPCLRCMSAPVVGPGLSARCPTTDCQWTWSTIRVSSTSSSRSCLWDSLTGSERRSWTSCMTTPCMHWSRSTGTSTMARLHKQHLLGGDLTGMWPCCAVTMNLLLYTFLYSMSKH